jgi:hypothetical protein
MLLPCVIRPEGPAPRGAGSSGVPLKLYVPLLCLSGCFLLGRREARRLRRHHEAIGCESLATTGSVFLPSVPQSRKPGLYSVGFDGRPRFFSVSSTLMYQTPTFMILRAPSVVATQLIYYYFSTNYLIVSYT